ncbi:hypothetical protein GCM10007320_08800 [Pseudorhodoferax aquiterrae]|uniref:Uncharacterized protein n=1 Tax=Pseudorhodoferax aquiterrae TaxID=747304 RepID=A0ABQ3FWK4_9BURK|nr:hypothetical protein GCM10007320_08800 [Pseudorhodoferax aquiterrae]
MTDSRADFIQRAGADLARQSDAKILAAIEERIGPVARIEDLEGRLTRLCSAVTTWYLDGEPILDVWPVEVVQEGMRWTALQRTRSYPVSGAS